MTPLETDPDMPMNVQESLEEAKVSSGLHRVGGTECSSACIGPFEGGHHYLHYLHHSLKVKVKLLSHVQLFVTPWTSACQAPLSMGFSRQEY